MINTYVFDFYNLYLPKGKSYINKEEGVRIIPLKPAEDFEKNRTKLSSPFKEGGWRTAKCYIKATNEEEAKKIAEWLEFLYSFAQSRSIFFRKWYKYKSGKKYFSFSSKFIEPRENRFPELIHGTHLNGATYTRDINLFINTAIKTLKQIRKNTLNEILTTIHAYIISKSQMAYELKFLICWIALEKLSNSYYNKYKSQSKNKLFTNNELKEIKEKLEEALDLYLKQHTWIALEELSNSYYNKYKSESKNKQFTKDELEEIRGTLEEALDLYLKQRARLNLVKRSIKRDFLYEHNTYQKMVLYLDPLDLGFEKEKLKELLKKLIDIRVKLVHNLNSNLLVKHPQYLMYLQRIMEQVIFRLLGVSKSLEEKFLLNQYNRGTEI